MLNLRNTLASQVGAVILDSLEAAVGQFKYLLTLEHISQRHAYIGPSGCVCVCVCVDTNHHLICEPQGVRGNLLCSVVLNRPIMSNSL